MIHRQLFVRKAGLALFAAIGFITSGHAAEKVIFKRQSQYNTIFVTENEHGLRALRFDSADGARQSVASIHDPEHVELPYIRALMAALAFTDRPRSALVVGVGGGTFPMKLHRKLRELKIDAVDIDPDVINVAKSHFGFREDDRLHAHVADGRKFIEAQSGGYDLVVLDAFGPDSIPYSLATAEFLQAVKKTLTPRGMVLANVWSRASNDLYDDMIRTYQHVFGHIRIVDVQGRGNRIVVANAPSPAATTEQLYERCNRLTTEMSMRYDLASVLKAGLRDPGNDGKGAKVLFDRDRPKR